jgi:hypothetical protein
MFMMSASLEHHSVSDEHSSLIDEQLVSIKRSSYPKDNRTPKFIHTNCFGKPNKIFCRFVIEYIAMSLFFDYWGEHSASSGPAPYNDDKNVPSQVYKGIRWNMLLLVEFCHTLNPTRAQALFGETVKGNVEWGWEVPKLSKLFAKITTKKTSMNDYGIRSSWFFHDHKGHDKAMWIHHFFVMQFVHPYFRPPRDWDFSTPHDHFKNRTIKFGMECHIVHIVGSHIA